MRSPEEVIAKSTTHLKEQWRKSVLGDDLAPWPHRYPVGGPNQDVWHTGYEDQYRPLVDRWHQWIASHADDDAVQVDEASKKVGKLLVKVPTHVTIASPEAAANIAGGDWPRTLRRARLRRDALAEAGFTPLPDKAAVADVTALDEVDFWLLVEVLQWWRTHEPTGLTARQVPIPGLHAKWLDLHGSLVRSLLGVESLGLITRPGRLELTYLDPDWLARGGRRRDSLASDDRAAKLGYEPSILVITENKDTALFFPEIPGGIAVEGDGDAIISRVQRHDWFHRCPAVLYWGDLDAEGYDTLNLLRERHQRVESVLMDIDTYHRYEQFGVRTDSRRKPLKPVRRDRPRLTSAEQQVYLLVTDLEHDRPLRIEQERIPMPVAAEAVAAWLSRRSCGLDPA